MGAENKARASPEDGQKEDQAKGNLFSFNITSRVLSPGDLSHRSDRSLAASVLLRGWAGAPSDGLPLARNHIHRGGDRLLVQEAEWNGGHAS